MPRAMAQESSTRKSLGRVTPELSAALKLGGLCLFVGGVVVGFRLAGIDLTRVTPEMVRAYVHSFGVWAPVAYLAVYGQPVVPLPASVMTITGGLVFGPGWGIIAALTGVTLRACTQFGMARLLGREAVAKLLKGRMASLDQRIGERGLQTVLLIRLIPNVPFDLQNYGLGFSKVRFGPYLLGSFLGVIPASLIFVYLGHSLTDLTQLWKFFLAIILVVALIGAQRAWRRR
jgi:uncharacterized membrane protein YdjX (TVP38/TMEM64 family)